MTNMQTGLHDPIGEFAADIARFSDSQWAWDNYLATVRKAIALTGAKKVIEIGGGRSPSLSEHEVLELGVDYISNDISERELSMAPSWVGRAHFDVQTSDTAAVIQFEHKFDLAFSRMVMEHVESYERAYANIHRILRPGGVSLAFHPVLFALPFSLNRLLPQRLSARLVRMLFPNRTDAGTPKFPAYYSGCMISRHIRARLCDLGFTRVWQVPFWGHSYYHRLPLAKAIHARVTNAIQERRLSALAAYSITVAVK